MKRLEIVPHGFPCTLENCPIGLFMVGDSDEMYVKTEYSTNGKSECYIVDSGETYCGQRDRVQPCIIAESDNE